MDTSEIFVKMCKQAEEIQGLSPVPSDKREKDKGSLFWDNTGGLIAMLVKDNDTRRWMIGNYHDADNEFIWLPRQGQLQEMVFGTGQYGARQIIKALWDSCKEDGSLVPREEVGVPRIGTVDKKWSMEQLWLAFVMFERYQKIWDGVVWVEQKVQ